MGQLKIGWGRSLISTDEPVGLSGQFHVRISKGAADPLYATALVIEDDNDAVIMCSLDVVNIRCGLLDRVRSQLRSTNPEIPSERIFLNATHTHTGGDFFADNGAGSEPRGRFPGWPEPLPLGSLNRVEPKEYGEFVTYRTVEAIRTAWMRRRPGQIAWGYEMAVTGHNRRVAYRRDVSDLPRFRRASGIVVNGTSVMYGPTDIPEFSHYEAGADPFINLLYTFTPEGELTGAVINVPCPSQNSEQEYMMSADFWTEVRAELAATYGEIYILSQCAAAGDISPRQLHYRKAEARRYRLQFGNDKGELEISIEHCRRRIIARQISNAFTSCLSWAQKEKYADLPLRHVTETVHLQRRQVTEEIADLAERELRALGEKSYVHTEDAEADLLANSRLYSSRLRWLNVLNRYELQKEEPLYPMELHVVRLGNIAFATNQFELYMDYMHRIQGRSPFEQTFIVQLAGTPGDYGGTYLPTERGVTGKGYSACIFDNLVSPEGGQELVEATLAVLNELHDA
ncbi:MAG: hypothetical protein GX907_03210 [Clostridiaceae bacterium]|nr:hypothetical protein [Clostridiaceae bacterium]